MSYEGDEQVLCSKGHLHIFDCWSSPIGQFPSEAKCSCGGKWVWWNPIDHTNPPDEETGLCPGEEVELEVATEAVYETCNLGHQHLQKDAIYKIPSEGIGYHIEE